MRKIHYVTINLKACIKLGLTADQYILCDTIYFLATLQDNKHPGWCWAQRKYFQENFNIPIRTFSRTMSLLIELGLVEKHENKRWFKTTPKWIDTTNEEKRANMAHNEEKRANMAHNEDGAKRANMARPYKDEHCESKYKNPDGFLGNSKKIGEIIEIFKESLSPSLGYGNKTQRKACENLIGQVGEDESVEIAKAAVVAAGMPYGPRITTPLELWNNLGKLKSFIAQHKEFEDKNKHISDKQMEKILNNKLKL